MPESAQIRARARRVRPALVIAIVVFVLVVLRQPHVLLRPQFIWEEASAFWAASFTINPVEFLLEPWAGYFQLVPRAAFLVARLVPPEIAPSATFMLHAALIALVAAFLASDRMATAIPDQRVRLTLAVAVAVLPVAEPYISILSAQWFLALYLAGLSLVAPRRLDYPLVLVAGLSGVGAALTVPLFFVGWRPGRPIDRRGVLLAVVVAAQAAVVLASGRQVRSIEPWQIVVASVITAALVLAPRLRMPVVTRAAFGYVGIVSFALGAIAMGVSARYLLAGSAFLVLITAALLVDWRPVGVAFAAAVVFLMIVAFPIAPVADSGWIAQARCIGGPEPCRVTVNPREWSVDWSPEFRAPRGMDTQGMPVP